MMSKVQALPDLAKLVQELKRAGKKVVLCHGVFDLVHPGHLRHFASAKRQGDILVVTVTADKYVKRGPGRPIFNENLRSESLAALEIVDLVGIVAKPTAIECLELLKPDVYAKGPDYKQAENDVTGMISQERKSVEKHGGKLHITDDVVFSSTKLINEELDAPPEATRRYLQELRRRYSIEKVTTQLLELADLKVLVIGDAIIDEYDYCLPMGKSGKEPLVVSNWQRREDFAGGALATANHAASLSRQVQLLSLLGRSDSRREFINNSLGSRLRAKYFYRLGSGTTIKRRYVSEGHGQKMFEVYFMDDELISGKLERDVLTWLDAHMPDFDVVLINDFGHGFVTGRMIDLICSRAKKLAINVQTNGANTGFNLVTKYPRADFVCVDEVELRYAAHDRISDLKNIMRQVRQALRSEILITTRGKDGSLALTRRGRVFATPAFATQIVDAVGAGDAFFAFAGVSYAGGLPADLIPFIGNVAGSLATQIVGNERAVELPDVLKFAGRLLK